MWQSNSTKKNWCRVWEASVLMTVGFARVMWPQMWHSWPAVFSINMTVGTRHRAKHRSRTCTLLLFHWEHVPITVWRGVMRLQTVLAAARPFPLRRWSLYLPVSGNEAGVRDWKWREEEECDLGAEGLFHSFVRKKTEAWRQMTDRLSFAMTMRMCLPFIQHQMLSERGKDMDDHEVRRPSLL